MVVINKYEIESMVRKSFYNTDEKLMELQLDNAFVTGASFGDRLVDEEINVLVE